MNILKNEIIKAFPPSPVYFTYTGDQWVDWQDIPNSFIIKDEFFIDLLSEKELFLYVPRMMIFSLDDLEEKYLTDSNVVNIFLYRLLYYKEFNCLKYSNIDQNNLIESFLDYIFKQHIYSEITEDYQITKRELIASGCWRHPFK